MIQPSKNYDPRCAAWLPGSVLLVGEAGTGSVRGYDPDGRVVLTLPNTGGVPGADDSLVAIGDDATWGQDRLWRVAQEIRRRIAS